MHSVFVRHRWEPYLWILPSILLMLVFVVFPIGPRAHDYRSWQATVQPKSPPTLPQDRKSVV